MPRLSAGIILYHWRGDTLEVLLVHPGGPFWRHRDKGAWMIPKGMVEAGEGIVEAALREFHEELGTVLAGPLEHLCRVRQSGGKWVEAFAMEGELDPDAIVSNQFIVEYPPGSDHYRFFPEVDRAAWFSLEAARANILPSQQPILDALAERLGTT